MKNKVIGILLMVSLVLPVLISYIVLDLEKRTTKKEVKRKIIVGLSHEELDTLKFSTSQSKELKWEHENEFEWNGKMYDIVRSETQGDSIFYECWQDQSETQINVKMAQLVSNMMESDSEELEKKIKLIKFFDSFFYVAHGIQNFANAKHLKSILFIDSNQQFQSQFLALKSPPPRIYKC